jgi:hypothetical protein
MTAYDIPKEMKAIRYTELRKFSLVNVPVPKPKAHEILIKGTEAMIILCILGQFGHTMRFWTLMGRINVSQIMWGLRHGLAHPRRRLQVSDARHHGS